MHCRRWFCKVLSLLIKLNFTRKGAMFLPDKLAFGGTLFETTSSILLHALSQCMKELNGPKPLRQVAETLIMSDAAASKAPSGEWCARGGAAPSLSRTQHVFIQTSLFNAEVRSQDASFRCIK